MAPLRKMERAARRFRRARRFDLRVQSGLWTGNDFGRALGDGDARAAGEARRAPGDRRQPRGCPSHSDAAINIESARRNRRRRITALRAIVRDAADLSLLILLL